MAEPRRGLALMGGGALGAWQAAALRGLLDGGARFHKVMGFSIGAFHAAALAFDRMGPALAGWRGIDGGILRLSPRLKPRPSLFSDGPVRDILHLAAPEGAGPDGLKLPLCLVTAVPSERRPAYAVFDPAGRWEGDIESWLLASAAIPAIFPPVRIGGKWHIDGGVPMREPLRFDFLADCDEVWTVEFVRDEDRGLRFWNPYYALDQGGREGGRELMDQGLESLRTRRGGRAPSIRRLFPSRRLDTVMLDFSARAVRPMLEQGFADAKAFLAGRA
ncbi:MAG: patatin-like phospholipase family protein [Elusimicrobiota bacterium]|nr:patatin-like phospholipase family protein [Elusimicrobiota bacterium]